MQVTFDPTVPAERELVRRLMRPLKIKNPGPGRGQNGPKGGPGGGGPGGAGGGVATDPRTVRQGLNQLLGLACGEFLALAAAHFEPEAEFTVPALAEASGVPAETLLSKNRTLGHSCRVRGLKKRDYLTAHGGTPRRFSVPQWVAEAVAKQAEKANAEQAN